MSHFYQYDTRGASHASQIITLERMVEERDERIEGLIAERDALRALLAEALPELRGELWHESRICSVCFGHNRHRDVCLVARIDAALKDKR